ncbi:MAG: RNA polymerase sigma factor RpoE [Gammaproteobacteria bacterium]|uniref:RNA polymerase sigma factor n=1 Tax=Candidatus Thiopontia autotrophica TaxID=2841688 RepID=A0A8J6TXP8_9GAMM|nr:RNA polymerase sigma factor RpoE [Candidatus Thiopontia autotrophica]MBL6968966.1 RNA polymerase sigma factor RpoE [Gammaproteobacteria bacterium]
MEQRDVDQLLVEQVQKGDKRAFDLLVLKYQHKVISLVRRFVKDHAESEDVAQDAFIRAYRALANFRGDSAFYTWLYRIAVNTAKNHLTAKGRRPPATDLDAEDAELLLQGEGLTEKATPESELLRDELQQTLVLALENLSADLKMAITLRELEGMSYDEIAEIMDCPIGTVRSRIFRAREAISQQLQELGEY